MAAFNPQTSDAGVPNSTGASQGTGPNRTFETLFSGLTETAGNLLKIKDQTTQAQIATDAQQAFDQTNQDFGVAAPPQGLTDELDRMKALQSAVDQGKISQVNYYGRLATLSKQLRVKYPGYEQIVDSTIQSVTGTRPANAYRDAIFQELANSSESASNEVKFRRQYEKENEAELSLLFGDEYFKDPAKFDFDQVRSKVASMKGKKSLIDAETAELGLMSKRGEFNDTRAARAIDQDFGFVAESTLSKSLGLNSPSAYDQINQFVAKGGGSPEEFNTFIGNISAVEADLRAQLTIRGRQQYVQTGILPQEAVNKAIESALYPIVKAKEAVLGGDFKLAARYATINKAASDEQLGEMLKDPEFKAGQGLQTVSQTLGDAFFNARQEKFSTLALEVAGRTMAGQTDIVRKTVESGNQPVTREVLTQTFKAIIDPKLQGDQFSNVIDQYFGPKAVDFMSPKVVAPADLEPLFLQFLRPEVTAAIVQKGSPEDLKKYTEWAMEKVTAIPAFRSAAGEAGTIRGMNPDIKFEFDPQSFRFKAFVPGMLGGTSEKTTGRTLDALNRVMTVMRPIFEANGDKDGLGLARQVIKNLNIDLEGGSKDGFWRSIYNSIPSIVGEADAATPGGQEITPVNFEGDDQIDFITTNAINPQETAQGDTPVAQKASYTPDNATLSSSFVDPKSNPEVNPKVLARYGGRKLPASIRLNNMGAVSIVGNVNSSFAAKQPGFVGTVKRPAAEGGYYAVYATPEHGVAAASKLLERYGRSGTTSPIRIVSKWSEDKRAHGTYARTLVKYLRQAGYDVDANTKLDLADADVRVAILKAKSAHESGAGKPVYSDDVFEKGAHYDF